MNLPALKYLKNTGKEIDRKLNWLIRDIFRKNDDNVGEIGRIVMKFKTSRENYCK